MLHIKVATEYRGSASFMCNYNLTIRTLICINLNVLPEAWDLTSWGYIYIGSAADGVLIVLTN
jgi:hypothetical protein